MLDFYNKKVFVFCIVILSLIARSNALYAQCAGNSNTVSVCEKEQNPGNQNFNLFLQLNGNPVTGGIWESDDPFNNDALDEATGIVNLWSINITGSHSFTYTVPSCNNMTATVTIDLGGYSGENNVDGGANTCQGDVVNLFSFLDSISPDLGSDINGDWEEVPIGATGGLTNEIFDTNGLPPGNYTFDYTVPAVGDCPSRTSRVILEIHRLPVAGTPIPIGLCETEDFSLYTSVDLFDHLINEDTNGQWFDDVDTGQITTANDHIINLEELYDTMGPGIYSYTYRVVSQQGVCPDQMATVEVVLERKLILNGSVTVEDFCRGNGPAVVTINYDANLLDEGFYLIDGTLTGGVNNTFSEYVTLYNGTGTFTLPGSFPANVNIIVTVTDIGPHQFCTSDLDMAPDSFKVIDIHQPNLDATNICLNQDVVVTVAEVMNETITNPSNDSYALDYTLISPSGNTQTLTSNEVEFTNGIGVFLIDSESITETGVYVITIAEPFNFTPPCDYDELATSFLVTSRPSEIQLALLIDNPCEATSLEVMIAAPYINNGEYTVHYTVTETNSSTVLISNTIVFTGGVANFDVNISNLPQGNYTVRLHSIQNDSTPCRENFEFEEVQYFSIEGIPDSPVLLADQSFCLDIFLPGIPTLEDIVVISGQGLEWFDTETSTIPLSIDTPLVHGEDYFVVSNDPINDCYSSERSSVQITLTEVSMVIIESQTPVFCNETTPLLSDITVQTQNGGDVVWYDSPTGENQIDPSTPLINGATYYAGEQLNDCVSNTLLAVTPTIIAVPNPIVADFAGNLCIIDQPNINDIEENVTIPSQYNLRWYADATSTIQLDPSQLVEPGIYFVSGFEPNNGCESDRIPVAVSLFNCSPDDYVSLIPDGFSPNNDTVNDFYTLVNFDQIFPDYSIEIYNRYGKIVFEGNTITGPWDGTSSESAIGSGIMPTGVYFYVIEFNKLDLPPQQGRLYLSR